MSSWQTEDLPEAPNYTSPGGTSEIRLLPSFQSGELAHAKAPPECVAKPAILTGITEVFYVVGGSGELWRRQGESEETIELVVGRSPTIPPGVDFQYRTHSDPLELIVFSAPRWEPEAWSEGAPREWPEDTKLGASGSVPWSTIDLPEDVDYLAPDGSEIRLLPSVQAGRVLTNAELTQDPPLLVGHLGATEFPHTHIQAALAGSQAQTPSRPRFDPTVVVA